MTRFRTRKCLLGVPMAKNNVWGSKSHKNVNFGGGNRHFRPNLQNFQTVMSRKVAKRLTWNFNTVFWPWQRLRGWSVVAKYQFKMAAAAILDFWTNLNNSAVYWATVMKFDTNIPIHNTKGTKWQKWSREVNSRWRRPPSWNSLNGHNSANFQPICTKFHTGTENGVP